MSQARQTLMLVLRLALVSVAMLVAYMLSTMVIPQTGTTVSPEEAGRSALALVWSPQSTLWHCPFPSCAHPGTAYRLWARSGSSSLA